MSAAKVLVLHQPGGAIISGLTDRTTVIRTLGTCPTSMAISPQNLLEIAHQPQHSCSPPQTAFIQAQARPGATGGEKSPHAAGSSPSGCVSLKGCYDICRAPAAPAKPPAAAPWLPGHLWWGGSVIAQVPGMVPVHSLCRMASATSAAREGGRKAQFYRGDWSPHPVHGMSAPLCWIGRLADDL